MSGSGYSLGDPIYRSYPVDTGVPEADLHVWHWNGTTWSSFSPSDLNSSQGYANFTVSNFSGTNFGGYAVTEVVPEPSTLALLGAAALLLLAMRSYSQRRREMPPRYFADFAANE